MTTPDDHRPHTGPARADKHKAAPGPLSRLAGKLQATDLTPHDPWEGFAGAIAPELEKLRAALAQSSRGVALQGAEVRSVNSGQALTRVSVSAGRLVGWSLRETTGAGTALIYLRDGRDTSGAVLAVVSLGAGESVRDTFAPAGLSVLEGVVMDVAAGAVEGAIYLGGVE